MTFLATSDAYRQKFGGGVGRGRSVGALMLIRTATKDDHEAIWTVNALAFESGNEPLLVDLLRATPDVFDPELDIVAEDDGEVVGHILFTWVELTDETGAVHRVLQLGPLAITPRRQGQGVGGDLVREGLRRAEAAGSPLVMIMGHPTYYPRFGFLVADDHGILYEPGGASPAFMVHPIGNETPSLRGTVRLGDWWDTGVEPGGAHVDHAVLDAIRARRAELREHFRAERGRDDPRCGEVSTAIAEEHGFAFRTGHVVLLDGTTCWPHCWNELPGGDILDATADQFDLFPGDILLLKAGDPLAGHYQPSPGWWEYDVIQDGGVIAVEPDVGRFARTRVGWREAAAAVAGAPPGSQAKAIVRLADAMRTADGRITAAEIGSALRG